ncbi:MAG: alpha-amylase, partial [Chloroflexi bacterium]
ESKNNDVYLFMREHPAGRCLVALNFSDQAQSISIPGEHGQTILSTYMDREGIGTLDKLPLRGNEGIIIKL